MRCWQEKPDYANLSAVMNASFAADGIAHRVSPSELEGWFCHDSSFVPTQDGFVAEVDGKVVAWTRVLHKQELGGPRVMRHGELVHPEWRDLGLGAALMDLAEARAKQIHSNQGSELEGELELGISEGARSMRQRAQSRGYKPVRRFFEMVRDLKRPVPDLPLPEGFEIRPVRAEHIRPIWEAMSEAFEDHWGHPEHTEDHYTQFVEDPLQDPDLWQVAWHGDQIAGMVLNFIDPRENEELDRLRGYTEDISVRRPFRRRGLAKALLTRSMRLLQEHGLEEAGLSVDSEHEKNALNLYRGLGFKVVRETTVYRKPLH